MSLISPDRLLRCAQSLLLCVGSLVTVAHAADTLPPRSEWRANSSSTEGPGLDRAFGIDGNAKTRWGGGFAAGDWYQVDLGRAASVGGVLVNWDTGFARRYSIQTSLDGRQWRTVFETIDSPGSFDYVFFPNVETRFVRIAAAARTADWGVSIFEFEPIAASEAPRLAGLASQSQAGAWTRARPVSLSGAAGAPRQLSIELPRPLAIAGLEVFWERAPSAAKLEVRDANGNWAEIANDPENPGSVSYLAAREARQVHALRMTVESAAVAPTIRRLRLISPSRALTSLKRYEIAANRANKELFPSSLRANQVYWTAVGVPGGRQKSIFDEYGDIEAFKGAPLIQPVWRNVAGKSSAAFDKSLKHSLRDGWMPMPAVEWSVQPGLLMRSEAMTLEQNGAPVTLVRHRLRNHSKSLIEGNLALVVRPMQICPPWQNAGLAPIYDVSVEGDAQSQVRVNGRVLLHSLTPTAARGSAAFGAHGEHEVTRHVAAGSVPAAQVVHDDEGLASAILSYSVRLDPGAQQDVVIALPLGSDRIDLSAKRWPDAPALERGPLIGQGNRAGAHFDVLANQVAQQWDERAGRIGLSLPDRSLVNMLRAQAAYMLINQTGPAIQPGPRNYNRSFIRDGAATAAVLVRMGMARTARD
ncbi:MAG TPA: discoidin domain-containing protein, partial [Steroidobacteraceae bacterium]|nr:discoidin domain-containing protein [Steroidobacteraceae bacterium]